MGGHKSLNDVHARVFQEHMSHPHGNNESRFQKLESFGNVKHFSSSISQEIPLQMLLLVVHVRVAKLAFATVPSSDSWVQAWLVETGHAYWHVDVQIG